MRCLAIIGFVGASAICLLSPDAWAQDNPGPRFNRSQDNPGPRFNRSEDNPGPRFNRSEDNPGPRFNRSEDINRSEDNPTQQVIMESWDAWEGGGFFHKTIKE